jgi:hypothetical protein
LQFNDLITVVPMHFDVEVPCAINPPTHYAKSVLKLKIAPQLINPSPGDYSAEVVQRTLGAHYVCEECYAQLLYTLTKVHRDLQTLK